MTFDEVLGQVLELLQQEKRVSYRGIQRRFSLDEACLADLKEELVFAHPEIADVDGRGLLCNDEAARIAAPVSAPAQSPAPASCKGWQGGHAPPCSVIFDSTLHPSAMSRARICQYQGM